MLPIIDLQSSNPTCIFIVHQAEKLGIKTPCVTFDQPLWYKALAIIEEQNLNVVCRLGGFHLLMSFLGSIGHLMGGSGIDELLEQVYASNVIHHILSGKAFARAIRGHFLIHTVLQTLMIEDLVEKCSVSDVDLEKLASFERGHDIDEDMQKISRKSRWK